VGKDDDDRFPKLPDLPSDEELGIAGLDEEELLRELEGERSADAKRPADAVRSDVGPVPPASGKAPPASPPPARPKGAGPTDAGPPARGSWAMGLVTAAVLLVGGWFSSEQRVVPAPVSAAAPATAFSSARATVQLADLARAPRPVGSPEHDLARERITGWLEELGLEVEVQTTLSLRRGADLPGARGVRAATVRNLVARIPGTAPTGAVLLTAHYDAVPLSHGAGDDGTGVVAILETARALLAGAPLANDVIVLITDAEEIGLLGARAFVEGHRWMDDVRVVLSAEMRGGGGPVHMFETGAENGWIVGALQASDPHPLASSLSVEVYRRLPTDTDFTPFREAGIQGMNFAAIGDAWIYHQPTDRPANIDEGSVQHMGARLLAVTRELGDRDLSEVHAPDLVYVTVPFLGIVSHALGLAFPISAAILLLWLGVCLLAVRRGGRWSGIAVGVVVVVATGALTALSGWGLLQLLPRFHAEFGSMTPLVHRAGWYMAALVAVAVAAALALLALTRRRFGVATLSAGALAPPVFLVLGLAMVAPIAALDLQIAALAGVLATGSAALGGGVPAVGSARSGQLAPWARGLVLLLALPALALTVPLVEGIWEAMSLRLWIGLAALLALGLACIVPALDGLLEPNRWWAPVTVLALAGLLAGIGILRAGPTEARPHPSTLLYVLDRAEGGEALWLTREDAGFDWFEETTGPFGPERTVEAFLLPGRYRTVAAPSAGIAFPELRYEGEVPNPFTRVVRLTVTSGLGAERITVLLPDDDGAGIVAVNGEPVPLGEPGTAGARRPVTLLTHQGRPQGDLVLDIELEDERGLLELVVIEEHLRPAELLSPEPFRRPPHLVPNPQARSDRMVVRTPLVLALDQAPPPIDDAGDGVPPEAGEPADGPTDQPPGGESSS
jgi:hypothetical protein